MLYVSLIVELLRSHPRAVFWLVTLAQAALWWVMPSLFYAAPPGDVALVLAIGHELQLGTFLGPPLAFWLAELAFNLAGMPGVYLLSQICVVVTYWAVFTLGCAVVGAAHAAIAVMLMAGILVFGVSTAEFGPPVLAMAISALILLHFWRAIGEGRRAYWPLLAVEIGLLLLTTYAGLILLGAMIAFTTTSRRGRAMLGSIDPWLAGIIVVLLMLPHLIWLDAAGNVLLPALRRLLSAEASRTNPVDGLRIAVRILALHAGLIIMVALAAGWRLKSHERVPVFLRPPVERFARRYIYYFAAVPLLLAAIIAVITGQSRPIGGSAPLVVLSGLAVVVAGGDSIKLHRQRLVSFAWAILLVLPPVLALFATVAMPWVMAADLQATRPAKDMGRYFSEIFLRRTGKPLEIIAGEEALAALAALYAAPRASLYVDAAPAHSPWVQADDIRRKGALVVWRASDTAGTPPAAIRTRFPDLVADVPRAFERTVQGRAPVLRVGWGILRPQEAAPATMR